jgi:hypothetical protein
MVYAPVTGRVIVFTDGVVAEYDPVAQIWETYDVPGRQVIRYFGHGPLLRMAATLVYDSLHQRVLMYWWQCA